MMDRLLHALGWTLLHSCWQLALVGLGAALGLRLLGPGRLRSQYGLACAALLLCLGLPLVTFLQQWVAGAPVVWTPAPPMVNLPVAVVPTADPGMLALPWSTRVHGLLDRFLPWISALWALGTAFMALRLAGGWATGRRWRAEAQDAPEAWQGRLEALADQMALGTRVLLRTSARVAGPVVLGLWRPVVLVPASLLTSLPEPYLLALLAHELAHVKRHDYLFNLLQNVLDVLLFHHPTVWWLSRRIRSLREHLADELATRTPGAPRRLDLARALDALDDFQRSHATDTPEHPSRWALAARGGSLFARIQHLVTPPTSQARPAWIAPTLLAFVLPCAALTVKAAVNPPIPGEPAVIQELDALAVQEGLDPHLLRSLAWVESGLNRKARSRSGALGVLQVMPETARRFGATDLEDPAQVATAGARYLKHLLDRYQGDVAKAVTAYNGGEQAVDTGQVSKETGAHVPLVMSVLEAKAVQPASQEDWTVQGVFRRLKDGEWMQISEMRVAGRALEMELLEDRPGGGSLARVRIGEMIKKKEDQEAALAAPAATRPGPPSQPNLRFEAKDGTALRIRVRCGGRIGETRVVLDQPWKGFAFTMTPQG